MTIRVLLVEDNTAIRGALLTALASTTDIDVVGEATDGVTAIKQSDALLPQVIVLDVHLPDFSGIEVARRLEQAGSAAKIVALSAYSDKRFVTAMLRCGASGYVTKASAGRELVTAIRAVAGGQRYLCAEVAAVFAPAPAPSRAEEGFAPKEQ